MKKTKLDRKTFIAVTAISASFVLLFSLALALILLMRGGEEELSARARLSAQETAGFWIASVSNIDFPSAPDLSREALEAELDEIVSTAKNNHLNTVCFQVRPAADALYQSSLFPVSVFLSSKGELTLDALEYLIDAAHKESIAVHAWVNPLRVTAGGISNAQSLGETHPATIHPEWTVEYADGRIYFDCGIPAVRALIADGVREIVENYDVDGIIFDDYFYPYPKTVTAEDGSTTPAKFDDDDSFAAYGAGFEEIADWRRNNVNQMVQSVYETVKDANPQCLFGIAPFGIWKNGYGDDSGSVTRGAQSYYDIYCDTLAWARGNYVDYIAPQLYWRTTDAAAPYDVLCDWWETQLAQTEVLLLICHGAYRYEEDWTEPNGIITSQVTYARQKEHYCGSLFYGYEEIRDNTHGLSDELTALYGDGAQSQDGDGAPHS